MAIVLTGTKTVTRDLAPHLSGAVLTAILAKAPEQLSVSELKQLGDAIGRVSGGSDSATLIGSLLS